MKFLIFGGSGFVGKALVKYLKEKNEEVKIVSRSAGVEGFSLDISNKAEFDRIDFIPDVVINCASRLPEKGKTSQDPRFVQELFNTNVLGGLNITNWAVSLNIKKIVNCSTLVVVKKPWPVPLTERDSEIPEGAHVAYSMSKLSQEQLMTEAVKGTQVELVHARLAAVYGPDMIPEGLLFQLMKKLFLNEEVELIDSKKNSIDFIRVEDVAKVLYSLARARTSGESVFNVATGLPVSIYELAEKLRAIICSDSRLNDTESIKKRSEASISIEKLKAYTGLDSNSFIPLNKGLKDMVSTYRLNLKSSSL